MARSSRGRVEVAPLDSAAAAAVLASVPPEQRFDRAWLNIDGILYGGDESIWQALYALPWGWLLIPLRRLPRFHAISGCVYRWVAEHRPSGCRVKL